VALTIRFGHASGPRSRRETFMQLISGPPRDVVFGWAQDAARLAMQIYKLPELDAPEREEAVAKLAADDNPTSLEELVDRAAFLVIRGKLGWYRRNQFFGGLVGYCVLMGMPKADAKYLMGLIRTRLRQETPVSGRKWAIFAC
jgi:hypothetical protein